MKKKIIKLTESDLHRIIKKSVNRVLKEAKTVSMISGNEYDENNLFHPEWGDEEWDDYNKNVDNEIEDMLNSLTDEQKIKIANALKKSIERR